MGLISAEWVGILVAVILGVANLAVTLGLDRRRQHERAVDRQAREAQATFEQDVRAPLRNSLQARRLADLVHEFSTACRLWLSEISEALSSGQLQPPGADQTKTGARSRSQT